MLAEIFILLLLFQVKHYVADFPLQNTYMLGKFKKGWDFIGPLSAHCGVHALFTLLIAIVYGFSNIPIKYIIGLALADFVLHFIMDRIKASPKYWGKYQVASGRELASLRQTMLLNHSQRRAHQANLRRKYKDKGISAKVSRSAMLQEAEQMIYHNRLFWWCLGFDQMFHHLTHYGIIYMLVVLKWGIL